MHQLAGNAGRKPRRALRRQTRAEVTVIHMGTQTAGMLRDLSPSGAAIDLMGNFHGIVGSQVKVKCDGFCTVEAQVRWLRERRIGVEFDPSSNTAAKVHAYFKFYHREPLVPAG